MGMNFTEPCVVPEIFATDLARVEPMADGLFRLIFVTRQRPVMYEGGDEYCVIAKMIVSERTLRAMRSAFDMPAHVLDEEPLPEGFRAN